MSLIPEDIKTLRELERRTESLAMNCNGEETTLADINDFKRKLAMLFLKRHNRDEQVQILLDYIYGED